MIKCIGMGFPKTSACRVLYWAIGAVFLLSLFVPVLMAGQAYRLSGRAGEYDVTVVFPQGPVEGQNIVEIGITDRTSHSVTDARVIVEYLMPSLPGKPPMMDYTTTAKPQGSTYRAVLNLNMKGEWKMIVTVTKDKKKSSLTLPFEVK